MLDEIIVTHFIIFERRRSNPVHLCNDPDDGVQRQSKEIVAG